MSDIRELLELAARAMGIELEQDFPHGPWHPLFYDDSLDRWKAWNPREESGDCADMCAALGIDTQWRNNFVRCAGNETHPEIVEYYDEHNDRSAAWRMAALRVAAEIGRAL